MIPIAKPLLGLEEAIAASRVVMSGWVSQGPQVAAFESEFAAFTGADHACAVSNCTTALHLALLAVGVGPGDEVITVSHSFIAGANAIRQCGAVPVFVDIEPDGFNIDPTRVAEALSSRTTAILCVHQMGMPCNVPAILEIAKGFGVPVIEDAACAIGSEILTGGAWQRIGRPLGDVVCFSFHPRKVITTGEGGMLTTNRPELDQMFRLLRQHGMSVSDTARHDSAAVIFESYPVRGYNYRMTDIQASIGREQLKRLPKIISNRRTLADRYRVIIFDRPGLGYTDRIDRSGTTIRQQADLLVRAAGELGAEQPIVMGQSYGGAVALAWAVHHPDSLSALVPVAAASNPWTTPLDPLYRVTSSWLGSALVVPMLTAFVTDTRVEQAMVGVFAPQPVPEGYIEHFGAGLTLRRTSLRANAMQRAQLLDQIIELQPRYGEISVPTEIIHGTADDTVNFSLHSGNLERQIPGAVLTPLPGVGHMPQHVAAPDVAAAIDRAAARAGLR